MEGKNQDVYIRDLLYFDFDKAASLLSQIQGGLLGSISETKEKTTDDKNLRTYDLKIFRGEFGGVSAEKTSVLESRFLHHDLFTRIEDVLTRIGVIADVNKLVESDVQDPEIIRTAINGFDYIKVQGWVAFEDYERLSEISESFNALVSFVTKCEFGSAEILKELQKRRSEIGNEINSANKNKKLKEIENLEKEIAKKTEQAIKERSVPEWLFEGIRLWIGTYIKDRLNLRVYPFVNCPSFEVIANLKKECFVDANLNHIMYGYGTYPNKKLSVLGLITSVPKKDAPEFDIGKTMKAAELSKDAAMEEAYRGVFVSNDVLERMTSSHRYPRVVIHPIAVFRDIKGSIDVSSP